MKTKHLFGLLLIAGTLFACKEPVEEPTKPEDNSIAFSVKYGEMTQGVTQPESVVLTLDNTAVDVKDGKFTISGEQKESYLVSVYNQIQDVTVKDGTIALSGAGSKVPSIDWLFCYAGDKKLGKSLSVTLQQQTKQIDITVRAMGSKIGIIKEATAEITGVAGQRDLVSKVYKSASTVSTTLDPGVLAGSFFGEARVLGFVPDAASELKITFVYTDGTTSTTTVDLSAQAESFNEDKTVINLATVRISDVGEATEAATLEVTNDGALDNKDNTSAADAGDKKMTINWPSYNTATRLEVKADGTYYVGNLAAATDAGQATENGFATLPAADKIEEVAIYVGTERLVAPAKYMTYADGVITVEDCKLVYKSEQLNDEYITKFGTYVQTADLVVPEGFVPIGASFVLDEGETGTPKFRGKYDGQGFSISGMNFIERDESAFFRYNAGTIENLVIKDSKFMSGKLNGGVAGRNDGTIKNCISYVDLVVDKVSTGYNGGIVGQCVKGLVSFCQFHGTIKNTASGLVGGIAGTIDNGAIVENCLNTGVIDATVGYSGGIAGRNRGIVRACKNTADHTMKGGTQWTGNGGVVGRCDNGTGKIIACVNTGNISGDTGFGGICGILDKADASISACYSTGLLIDVGGVGLVGKVAGWLLGRNGAADVYNCYTLSEGQPKTSNGAFGNGNAPRVDIKLMDGETPSWPEADASKGWGIYTDGCDPTQGYYWKDLGNAATKTYPKLWWEE